MEAIHRRCVKRCDSRGFVWELNGFALNTAKTLCSVTYLAFLSHTTTSANSLKTLQNVKHRKTTENTTGKQGKSVLFTEHHV